MQFFDSNLFFGLPMNGSLEPVPTAEDLLAEMDRAGIAQALVWHIAQHDASPQVGNQLLAEAIAPYPRLKGCWTVLPNQTGEFPPPDELLQRMAKARVAALRIFPRSHRFLANEVSMGELFAEMVAQRIPLFVSLKRGMDWQDVYALLAEYPDLVCAICDHGCWGMDRMFRPLLSRYPNVYVDTSQYLLDGGFEALVADYGPDRILFGSGFPESYFGTMMLTLQHSGISTEAKAAIAGGNLQRILAEERL